METIDARNVWVLRVDAGRRQVSAFLAIALAVIVLAAALAMGAVLSEFQVVPGTTIASEALDRGLRYAAILGPLGLWAMLAPRFWEHRARLVAATSAAKAAFAGLIAALVAFSAVLLIALADGSLSIEHAVALPSVSTLEGVLVGAFLLAFQSSAEECFFRGWLQPILAARFGVWPGLVVVSVLFSAAHAVLNAQSVTACVNIFLAGMLFGLLALRFGNLWAPFAAHWAWNWVEQSVVGLTPNPGVDPLGSLFDLKLTGSWLAGAGPDELNGAAAVTVVFAIVIAALGLFPAGRVESSARALRRSERTP